MTEPSIEIDAEDPADGEAVVPTMTAMGILTRDHMHPGGIAVCQLIGERVFPLVAELLPDDMPQHEAWQYAADLQQEVDAWRVFADVTTAGRDVRQDIGEALGHGNVKFAAVSERVTDANADVNIRKPLREVTSRLDWLLDHESYVRLHREHPAETALQTYAARRQRPDEDEQKFVRDESDSYVIPLAGACDLLNPSRWPTISIPFGRISDPATVGVRTIGPTHVDVRRVRDSGDALWAQMREYRHRAWDVTQRWGVAGRQRPWW